MKIFLSTFQMMQQWGEGEETAGTWAMVKGAHCVLSLAHVWGRGQTDQLLSEFKVLIKHFPCQWGTQQLQKSNDSPSHTFPSFRGAESDLLSSLVWPLRCKSYLCLCVCVNEVCILVPECLQRQRSPIGCHHSCMTGLWQQDCVLSVLPGFAYIQSTVVACQTKLKGICIVVSLLVPFTCPLPLQSHLNPIRAFSHHLSLFFRLQT